MTSSGAGLAATFRTLPHRRAFSLAWPAILGNITVPLVGLVDTAMLGNFSDELHLGAVAIGSTVITAVFWLLAFLRTGTTSLVGRALGAGREGEAVVHAQRALVLAGGLALFVVVVQWFAVPLAMSVLAPEGDLRDLATQYALIRFLGAPAALATLVITGWFVGTGDTKRPLAIVATVNIINLGLDVWFVAGLGWESRGAATASVIAEWVGLLVAVTLWWRVASPAVRAAIARWRGRGLTTGWRRLMTMNADLFVRTAILYAVLTFVTAYGARLGAEVLAANAILMQLMLLASYGQDGYAHAAEAMAAKEIGAGKLRDFHRASAAVALPAVSIGLVFTLLYWAARDPLLGVMTDLPGVADTAREYWPWIVWLPLLSAGAYLFDGVFLGAGKTRWMVWMMAASALLVFAPMLWLGVAFIDDARNHDLWRAFVLFNVARGLFLGVAYWRITRRRQWLDGEPHPAQPVIG